MPGVTLAQTDGWLGELRAGRVPSDATSLIAGRLRGLTDAARTAALDALHTLCGQLRAGRARAQGQAGPIARTIKLVASAQARARELEELVEAIEALNGEAIAARTGEIAQAAALRAGILAVTGGGVSPERQLEDALKMASSLLPVTQTISLARHIEALAREAQLLWNGVLDSPASLTLDLIAGELIDELEAVAERLIEDVADVGAREAQAYLTAAVTSAEAWFAGSEE